MLNFTNIPITQQILDQIFSKVTTHFTKLSKYRKCNSKKFRKKNTNEVVALYKYI